MSVPNKTEANLNLQVLTELIEEGIYFHQGLSPVPVSKDSVVVDKDKEWKVFLSYEGAPFHFAPETPVYVWFGFPHPS